MSGEAQSAGAQSKDVEVIADGDGLVVLGPPNAVERFVADTGVPSRMLDMGRLMSLLGKAGSVVQAASQVSANAGRWMKLTEESARAAHGADLVQRSGGAFVQATIRGANGQFTKNLEFVTSPAGMLTNPALLAGVGGLMAQYAMQRQMEEITDYLAKIDAKVDEILLAQKHAVFADMIGVELMVDDALSVRDEVGRVSEVTWSKVQGAAATIARTQAYALQQLDALAVKFERETNVDDIAEMAKQSRETVAEWLAVLARSIHLQEGLGVLELDRVFDASPQDLDAHRVGLQRARERRNQAIAKSTIQLVLRMDEAAGKANAGVLLNPFSSRAAVRAGNTVASDVGVFHVILGLTDGRADVEARRWMSALGDTRDDVVDAGRKGWEAAGRLGTEALTSVQSTSSRLAASLGGRLRRKRSPAADPPPAVSTAHGTDVATPADSGEKP